MKDPYASETTEEFVRRLQMDPDYQAMMAEKAQKQSEIRARLAKAEGPLIEDLRRVNIKVRSVWDLVNTPFPYGPAVPVLVKHLGANYPGVILEGIGRALGVPSARPYWRELVNLYSKLADDEARDEDDLPKGSLKMGLALALSAMGDHSHFEEMAALLRNRSLGPTRAAFIYALVRLNDPRIWSILEELAGDPDLSGGIADQLQARERRRRRRFGAS